MEFLKVAEDFVSKEIINSLVLLVALLVVRHVAERFVNRRTKTDARTKRQIISTVRNIAVVFLIVGLLFIWSPQLSSFALSLTAVALAIVIATKEIILNFSGAVLKMFTSPFEVGDWIEVDGVRGEVVSENLFAVKLEELDAAAGLSRFTGRTITIPNSKFLTSSVIDEGSFRNFVFHRFTVHVDPAQNAFARSEQIKEIAEELLQPFRAEADRALASAQRKSSIELPGANVLVRVRTAEFGNTAIEITMFCPTQKTIELEQWIARQIVDLLQAPQARVTKPDTAAATEGTN